MAYITLNRSNYFYNLDLLSKRAGGVEKIAVVLKDNAYGHGLKEMATLAKEFGVTKAIVKDDIEADMIDNMFEMILVLFPKKESKYSQTINSIEQLKDVAEYSTIHLKIDSGMHRNGIDEDQIEKALELIENKKLTLEGVMTHFRSADDLNSDLFWQIENWKRIKKRVSDLSSQSPLFHSFASSSLLRSELIDDFARCGIATYGYSELDRSFGEFGLRPVMKLWAKRISTRELDSYQRVGYGRVGNIDKKRVISTYDIGYGDGFFRHDGLSEFKIDEKRVVGRVSMDSISLESKDDKIDLYADLKDLSKRFNTISYDILVKTSHRLNRIII